MIVFVDAPESSSVRYLVADLQNSGLVVTRDIVDERDLDIVVVPSVIRAEPPSEPAIFVQLDATATHTSNAQLIDLSKDYKNGFLELLREIARVGIDSRVNPYKGLFAYGETDSTFFVGRKALTQEMYTHIEAGSKLLTVVGNVGSGKTSLVRAGLFPLLRNSDPAWTPIYVQLNRQPLQNLAYALQVTFRRDDSFFKRLYSNPEALVDFADEITRQGERFVLVIDQFESLFRYATVADRVYMLDLLHNVIEREANNFAICIVLQKGFENQLHEYPTWGNLLDGNIVDVLPLERDNLQEVITEPSKAFNVMFSKKLTDRIIADMSRLDKPSALSLLSVELSRLTLSGKPTIEAYEAHGGIAGSFAQVAEAVFAELTPIQQLVARRILLQGLEYTADGTPVMWPVPYSQARFTWVEANEVSQTLTKLLDARILREYFDFEIGERCVQAANPIVLNEWHRCKDWVNESSEELHYRSHLERLAATWVAYEYSEQSLLRGMALDEAINWVSDPDHFVSPAVSNFIDVSKQIRESLRNNEVVQVTNQRRRGTILMALLLLSLLVITGATIYSVQVRGERDALAVEQVRLNENLSTAVGQNDALSGTVVGLVTQQADADAQIEDAGNQLATSAAQNGDLATSQAVSSTDQANMFATIEILATQQAESTMVIATQQAASTAALATLQAASTSSLATQQAASTAALANIAAIQATAEFVQAQSQVLQAYIIDNMAQQSQRINETDPALALRLAAEAGSRAISQGRGDDPLITSAMQDALKANLTFDFARAAKRTWFLHDNDYAVIDYDGKADELWQLNPPQLLNQFKSPVEQIISVGNGQLFLTDYTDPTVPDELWNTESHRVVRELDNPIAPAPPAALAAQNPNVVSLSDGKFFILKYAEGKDSDLWDVASAEPIASLEGDVGRVVPLANGYFFASYTDHDKPGGIWDINTRKMVEPASDVVTTFFDNRIFALRRDQQFDEIWRTDPLRQVTQTVGRVQNVTTIQGSNYFIVEYDGNKAAEIWEDGAEPKLVQTLKGPIDVSITYLNRQYFFIRYQDQSNSEIWSVSPLEKVATLNGHLSNMKIFTVLGEEVVVLQYLNNAISEMWSLTTQTRLAQLSGDVADIVSILGDSFFVVQYKGNQPAEVWSAVGGKKIGTIRQSTQSPSKILALSDGQYLLAMYAGAPAEIWQVSIDSVTLKETLPDIVVNAYPIETGSLVVIDFLKNPAEIWDPAQGASLLTLQGNLDDVEYSHRTKKLSYVTSDHINYVINVGVLQQLTTPDVPLKETDLLGLVCGQLAESPDISGTEFNSFLAGLEPVGCSDPTLYAAK